ncbi:MAG: ABC transporter permease [Chlorobiaceae bacterium]|nr:ABC transporter permease [Chlorobiaceae bacterium]
MADKLIKIVVPTAVVAAFLLIWHAAASFYPEELFPRPLNIGLAIIELVNAGRLWSDIGISLFRLGIAYSAAVCCAVPLGILLGRCPLCLRGIDPLVQLIRPISPIAWFPLAVLWFGIGNAPAIFIIFIASFFPVLMATIGAIRTIPQSYYKVSRNFGAKPSLVFISIIIPAAFPGIMTGLHIALGTAWIHLVAGEMLGADSGLGFLIIDARNFLRTDLIMAGMILVGLLGLILNSLITLAEHVINRRWGKSGVPS